MNFKYRKFPVDPKNCPSPNKKFALRPVIQVDFETPSGNFGTSGKPQKAYFHEITFKIGGHSHTCEVGFSYDMEKLAYGLLGQDGFFNKWIVRFEYQKEDIDLRETESS